MHDDSHKENSIAAREILVGKSRHWLSADNIINVVAIGDNDDSAADTIKETIMGFFAQVDGKVDWLIDLNKAGKQSPKARKAFKETSEHPKTGKVACFGLHPVARVIASFVQGVSQNRTMRFFKTKEEALAWLKE
jgi:hypothetical protein